MFKAITNFKDSEGFTLIELLIVVATIGILASFAIPAYIGMQERGRQGAIKRAAAAAEPEIQAWLQSARKGGSLTEVDTNGDNIVDTTGNTDANNSQLGNWLGGANNLCSAYISTRWQITQERSPWDPTIASLWTTIQSSPTATNGRISCNHVQGAAQIFLEARDRKGNSLYKKILSAD